MTAVTLAKPPSASASLLATRARIPRSRSRSRSRSCSAPAPVLRAFPTLPPRPAGVRGTPGADEGEGEGYGSGSGACAVRIPSTPRRRTSSRSVSSSSRSPRPSRKRRPGPPRRTDCRRSSPHSWSRCKQGWRHRRSHRWSRPACTAGPRRTQRSFLRHSHTAIARAQARNRFRRSSHGSCRFRTALLLRSAGRTRPSAAGGCTGCTVRRAARTPRPASPRRTGSVPGSNPRSSRARSWASGSGTPRPCTTRPPGRRSIQRPRSRTPPP